MQLSVCVLKPGFRAEVRSVLRVLFMFVPLPLFHALFDQQVSDAALTLTTVNSFSREAHAPCLKLSF